VSAQKAKFKLFQEQVNGERLRKANKLFLEQLIRSEMSVKASIINFIHFN